MFSTLVSHLDHIKTVHPNPPITGNKNTEGSSEFVELRDSPAAYSMRRFLDADSKNPLQNSPYHETSTVEKWAEKEIPPSQNITTQKGQYQNFINASVLNQAGDVEPGEDEADEIFSKNLCSYLDDYGRHRRGPSPLQMLLFMTAADTHLALPVIQRGISRMVGFFGNIAVGEWFQAFKKNYPEYANEVELEDIKEK